MLRAETKVRIICRTIFSCKCFLNSKWTRKGGKNDTNAMPCVIRTRQHFSSFPTPFHRSLMTENGLLTQVSQVSGTYPSRKESPALHTAGKKAPWHHFTWLCHNAEPPSRSTVSHKSFDGVMGHLKLHHFSWVLLRWPEIQQPLN